MKKACCQRGYQRVRKWWYCTFCVYFYALVGRTPPDYVDWYGRRYEIDRKGTWRRKRLKGGCGISMKLRGVGEGKVDNG